jgi:hypothetical protein
VGFEIGAEKSSSESKKAAFLVAAFLGTDLTVAFLMKLVWSKPPSAFKVAVVTIA